MAVPSPPHNLQVAPQSPQSVLVTWEAPLQPKGQILKYLLIYKGDTGSSRQVEVKDTRKLLTGNLAKVITWINCPGWTSVWGYYVGQTLRKVRKDPQKSRGKPEQFLGHIDL